MKCLCGCEKDVDQSNSRGEAKRFVDNSHKMRYHRKQRNLKATASDEMLMLNHPTITNRVRYAEKERRHIAKHLKDASLLELPATLTLEEWLNTLDHFEWKCAYCQSSPYECLEHFVPLSLGRGTTATNCVPSCNSCNSKKKNLNPWWEESRTGIQDGIVRVRKYLQFNRNNLTVTQSEVKPILRYPGAKWSRAEWIVEQLPPFKTYVEPFFGSGAVFFSLPSVPDYAVLNDKSKSVVNLFEMIRTRGPELCAQVEMTPWARDEYDASFMQTGDPLEDARRFLVRCWMAHGTRLNGKTGWRNRGSAQGGMTYSLWNQVPDRIACVIDRLKYAEIENRDALDVIARFSDQEDCLMYVDPPYVLSTRSGALYEHEMKDDREHIDLLNALDKHVGPVVLSGYANSLYDERLKHWQRVTSSSLAESGKVRSEVLWLNEKAKSRQLNLFDSA